MDRIKYAVLFVLSFCLLFSAVCYAATEEDQAAADHVAELIDAIYVQERAYQHWLGNIAAVMGPVRCPVTDSSQPCPNI